MEYSHTFLNIIDNTRLIREYHEVCEKLGFHFDRNTLARNLSVAEQKMVEILKAMVHQASFIIMDEPTDSLADNEIQHLFDIIRDLKKHHITALYITHYLDEVFQITDRLTVLRDGKKVETVATDEVNTQDIVKMMVGQEISNSRHQTRQEQEQREAIRVELLSRKDVLSDISFRAYEGEILGITGVIGAGKSELARALFGADTIDTGTVYLYGDLCHIQSPVDAVKHGIGMLPEDRKNFGLLLNHEVYKNMTISALQRFISSMILSKTAELSATDQMVNRLDIKVSGPHQLVKYLSGGNQQKIVVGKWLIANPRILIMDEPTRGIDVGAKNEIYNIMRRLAEEGTCIIFISSEVPEIVAVSDRILVMNKGRIHAEFNQGATQQEIIHAMLEGGASDKRD
jgi:ribose transport system ATP-binding protein